MLRGAKGLSVEHVYILGVCKDALSGERRDEYPGHASQALLPSFLVMALPTLRRRSRACHGAPNPVAAFRNAP